VPRPALPHRARVAASGALGCAVLLVLTGLSALVVPAAHARDAAALHGFTRLDRPRLTQFVDGVAHLADPRQYAIAGLVLIAVAAARRRWALAALLPVLLVGSGLTTQLLKQLTAEPRIAGFLGAAQIADASWPSGHATAAMTLALCAVLVSPARHRPAVAVLGGAFAAAVAYAVLVLAWHFPSDVLGGFLVAAAWALAGIAALAVVERDPAPRAPGVAWQAAGLLLVLGVAAVGATALAAALVHPGAANQALSHPSFLAVAVAVASLAAALALATSRAVEG
jgi:membrane-associated phospholipid phosphatase